MAATMPVAVEVRGPMRTAVERVVEGALGWQVVDLDDPVLPPRCVLVDVPSAGVAAASEVPVVLLVAPDDDPVAAAHAARHAATVVDGVPEASALVGVMGRAEAVERSGRRAWCTVAGAAGGVGATTVATALGGLRAWRHGPTLVAVRGPAHQPDAPTVARGDLAGPAAWAAARAVVGVDGCRVVRLRDDGPADAEGRGATVHDAGPVPLVLELPTGAVADVLVVRPDLPGLAALDAVGGGAVVVVGRGPVSPGRIAAAAGDRRVVEVPVSARVAAAAARGRLPADVPGSWLRPLAELVEQLERRERREVAA